MPAPLLGPNTVNPHPQPEVQTYLSADTNPITSGSPVVFSGTPMGTSIVLASTTPANIFAGIALKGGTKGSFIPVVINGPVKAKTSATPAANAGLQLDGTGAAVTTLSSGTKIGYALEASVSNVATIIVRAS